MNTPVTASVVWTDPRGMIIPDNNPRRVVLAPDNDLVSSLLFLPIDIGHFNDDGIYTCAMTFSSASSLITSSQPNSTAINVTVECKLQRNTDFNMHFAFTLSLFPPFSFSPSLHTYSFLQVFLI